MTKSPCFIRISNEEIFDKINDIERKLDTEISFRIARLDKRVTIAVWTSGTALTLCIIIIGVLLR